MKLVQNIIYLRRLWYIFFYIFELLVSLTNGLGNVEEYGGLVQVLNNSEFFAWMTPGTFVDSVVFPSQHYEILCTVDWPIIIAARVSNISINLAFDDDNKELKGWPNVTRVNETTIRLCVEEGYTPLPQTIIYECFLTMTKTTLPKAHEKGTLRQNWGPESDSRFQKECASELLQANSQLHYLLANGSDLLSVCFEGLNRIKSSGFVQLVDNLTSISAMSQNDYEFLVSALFWIEVKHELGNESISLKCSDYMQENNTYSISQELLNLKLFEQIFLQMTSSTIVLDWTIPRNLQSLLKNWTYQLTEFSYRSEKDPHWYLISNKTEESPPENDVIVWDNVIDAEVDINFYFRFRIKSMFGPHGQKYLSSYFEMEKKISSSTVPETDKFMFHIFREPNKIFRIVTIYWRPMNISKLLAYLPYAIDVYNANGTEIENVLMHSNKLAKNAYRQSHNNFQAKYRIDSGAYVFKICSVDSNKEFSQDSLIYVPSAKDEFKSNIFLYSKNYLNSTLEYIWQIPKNQPDIVGFTIFWYWADKNSTDTKMDNVKMNWVAVARDVTKFRMIFDTSNSKLFRSFVRVDTENSSSGILAPRQTIFSISNLRKSGESWKLNQEEIETSWRTYESQNTNFKQTVDIGRKFSATLYQKWLRKILED